LIKAQQFELEFPKFRRIKINFPTATSLNKIRFRPGDESVLFAVPPRLGCLGRVPY